MKLQFKEQDFQVKGVKAIVDCFEGQSIKSARTQTVARILCLSFSDPKLSSESNFKNLKKVVRECTKDIRM